MKVLFALLVCLTFLNASSIAVVNSLDGEVVAIKDGSEIALKVGDDLEESMTIKTKENSGVSVLFHDDSFLALGANSSLSLAKYVFDQQAHNFDFELFLDKGTASFESGKIGKVAPEKFQFKTPEGTVAIRGTKFYVKVN